VSDPQAKELKDTQSWTTNALMKYFYATSAKKSKQDLTNFLKEIEESVAMASSGLQIETQIEASGYLTFIDKTPKEKTDVAMKEQK